MTRKYRYFVSKEEDAIAVKTDYGFCRFSHSIIAGIHPVNTLSVFADNLEKMRQGFAVQVFDMSTFEEVSP